MKRLFVLISMLLIGLGLFAQVGELPPVPETPWEAIGQFSYLIGSFPGVVVLMLFFVPFILGILNIQGKFLKYLFTILAVGLLVLAAYFFSFGYLNDSQWWTIPLNVAFLMLIQIGIFSWDVARDIMDKIYEKFNPYEYLSELICMILKKINIKKLKPGDFISAYDAEGLKWIKCKVNYIGKEYVIIEDIEGSFQGDPFMENLKTFQNPDYYRMLK